MKEPFNLEITERALDAIIAQHPQVAASMTQSYVDQWKYVTLDPEHAWLDGMIVKYNLPRTKTVKASVCFAYQAGIQYHLDHLEPLHAPLPPSFYHPLDPSAQQMAIAFCAALNVEDPYVITPAAPDRPVLPGTRVVRPEYQAGNPRK